MEIESLVKSKDGKPRKRLDNKSLKRIEAINLYSDYLEKKSNILKDKIAQQYLGHCPKYYIIFFILSK